MLAAAGELSYGRILRPDSAVGLKSLRRILRRHGVTGAISIL
jgi:hypothetical protein